MFILCYLLLYPHYAFAFDHVTIVNVNEDTMDKEFDNNIYQKNLFQSTSYLNAGYGLFMNILELCIRMFIHIT